MPAIFLSPGVWGPTHRDYTRWDLQDVFENKGDIKLGLLRVYLKYDMGMSRTIEIIKDSYLIEKFIKLWSDPNYEMTHFDIRLAKKLYEK